MKTLRLIGIGLTLMLVGSMDAQRSKSSKVISAAKTKPTEKPLACEELEQIWWIGPAKNQDTGGFEHKTHAAAAIIGDVQYSADDTQIHEYWVKTPGNTLEREDIVLVPVAPMKPGRTAEHKIGVVLGMNRRNSDYVDVQLTSCKKESPKQHIKVVKRSDIYEFNDEAYEGPQAAEETYGG